MIDGSTITIVGYGAKKQGKPAKVIKMYPLEVEAAIKEAKRIINKKK